MALIRLIPVFLALAAGATAESFTPAQFGMKIGTDAYEAVCWYENLKNMPKTNTDAYFKCGTQAEQTRQQIIDKNMDDAKIKQYFGKWLVDAMSNLPSEYGNNCNQHLTSGSDDGSDGEGEALNDQGSEYPYRAFAFCMIKTLRQKNGDTAVEAVKDERTVSRRDWVSTLLDRQNEFRALHGSKPLVLEGTLMEKAQKWSDQNAAACADHHIPKTDPDALLNGKTTGENLASDGFKEEDKAKSAYIAANGWYEEIKDYPFPAGISGGNDPRFHDVGHFTQTVWVGSEYAGYGYAHNPNCPGQKTFITARYYPAGNMEGDFQNNVKPPQ